MVTLLDLKQDPTIKVDLIFEPLTPIHIGGDGENHLKEGFDYILQNNKISIIDWQNTLKLSLKSIDSFVQFLSQGQIPKHAVKDLVFEAEYPIPPGKSFPEIKRLVRNGFGKPYIPGTSIKGALISNFIGHLVKGRPDSSTKLYQSTIGLFNNSLQQFFRVSDVELDFIKLAKTKVFNLRNNGGEWNYGWKDGLHGNNVPNLNIDNFSTTWETFPGSQGGKFRIAFGKVFPGTFNNVLGMLSPDAQSLYYKIIDKGNIKALFKLINTRTISYLKAEISFFEKFHTPDIQNVIELYQSWIKELTECDATFCILRMASGSGFHSITGDWQHHGNHFQTVQSTNPRGKRKSRRLIIEKTNNEWEAIPMGFVKIQLSEIWEAEKENKIPIGKQVFDVQVETVSKKVIEPAKPTFRKLEDYSKQGGIVDAKVVGQIDKQMKVELYLEGFEGKSFFTRYADGLNYFGKDTLIELDLVFPNPKNKKQFNLNNPRRK